MSDIRFECPNYIVIYGHKAVDLGLPSGLLWATANLAAKEPDCTGKYFAWGETSMKRDCDISTYKHADPETETIFKYTANDHKTTLTDTDDAAIQLWGKPWRMPTPADYQELIDYCTWEWFCESRYLCGYKVIGPNGNYIFLPITGSRIGTEFSDDYYGSYWTSAVNTNNHSEAYELAFEYEVYHIASSERTDGRTIRAVCSR